MSTVAETAILVWDYTMADIDRITKRACGATRRLAIDETDRWDHAWHAVVEQLYLASTKPTDLDLFNAACNAIQAVANDNYRHHGFNHTTRAQSRSFARYWGHLEPIDGFSDSMIERIALRQVLGLLTLEEYEALIATAAFGSQTTAARSLGINRRTFSGRVASARRRILEAWFEHETPCTMARKGTAEECSAGHARATHGYKDERGWWRCRICVRNKQRRARARNG